MALLSVCDVEKSFGVEQIFEDVSFEVQKNDKIGFIGANGTGKTTLFKIIVGEEDPDGGEIHKSKDLKISYMEQHVIKNLDTTVYDEVLNVFSDLISLEKELERINDEILNVATGLNELVDKQVELNDKFNACGGLTYKSKVKSVLKGLGFSEREIFLKIGSLSGGQKAKVQLAKLLLLDSNLMLLDEPTNHLDFESIEWLEDYLKSYSNSFILISHDRYFLDRVTNKTFDLRNKKVKVYKGSYSACKLQRDENDAFKEKVYKNTKKEINRLYGIVKQQRQWNREKNIKTAESKLKVIKKLEDSLDVPNAETDKINFKFGVNKIGGNDVLCVKNLSLSFDDKFLFSDVNIEIKRGEKVFLIGKNGCGKTSILRCIINEYKNFQGTVKLGTNIEIGYYDQIQSKINMSKTLIDEVWDRYPSMTQTEIRNALALFLFRGDDVFKEISCLSGGERAKILLLELMLSKSNFLILDEPTNHLDIESCESLENALECYEGTLLIVSHDRYLINKFADKIYYVDKTGSKEYVGGYDCYLEKNNAAEEKTSAAIEKVKCNEYTIQKRKNSELRKLKNSIKKLENNIEILEEKINVLKVKLELPENFTDYEKASAIHSEIEALEEELFEMYAIWENSQNNLDDKNF